MALLKKETILGSFIAAALVIAVVLAFGCIERNQALSVEQLLAEKQALLEKPVQVQGTLGTIMCTKMACTPENTCCNSCSAKLKGSISEINVSGKDCAFEALQSKQGQTVDINGILKKQGEEFYIQVSSQPAPQNSVWIYTEPRQCETTPWDKWHSDLNRTYIREPTEREILTEWLSTIGITVLDYKTESLGVVCQACGACPRGDKISIKVSELDAGRLYAMSSIQWLPENELSNPPTPPAFEKDSCIENSDCVKTSLGCCKCNSGGKEESVNKGWLSQQPEKNCQGVFCTEVYLCTDKTAKCNAGKCILE